MKKVFSVVLATLLGFSCLIGFAQEAVTDGGIDLSVYSETELVDLLDLVQNEIVTRGIEKTAILTEGNYVGGQSIPVGTYLISLANTEAEYNCQVFLRGAGPTNDNNNIKSNTYLDKDCTGTVHITIEEGDQLFISDSCYLTISRGLVFQ